MRAFTTTAVFAVLAGLSSAQADTSIDPDSVPKATRESWCLSQTSACPLLCLQYPGNSATTQENDCDSDTLVWSCVCQNGQTPNVTQFSQTIPYYECTTHNTQCVAACGQDNVCANKCVTGNPCGAQNPTRVNTSTLTTSAATGAGASATADQVITGFGGNPTATGSSSGKKSGAGSMGLQLGQTCGLAVVVAGLFAGFALVL